MEIKTHFMVVSQMEWSILDLLIAFLLVVFIIIFYISRKGLVSKVESLEKMIITISAPAETLTHITTSLGDSVSRMSESITNISVQAQKIEDMSKKYEETEALTRSIHNIMIGSYEKGRSGEKFLRNMMSELMKIGMVKQNALIAGKIVEYGVVFTDGKVLAIDSKIIATDQVDELFSEDISEKDRDRLRSNIRNQMKKKIVDVSKYIDPQLTLPCAVMAVPDSIVELSSDIVPEAIQRNVMVIGYSAVPQLIVYFIRIHGFYSIQEDVAEMKDRLMAVQQELSKIDESFFSNRFDRPITTIQNAISSIRSVVKGANTILSLEYREPKTLPEKENN